MHPSDCLGWEYETHPDHKIVLVSKLLPIYLDLESGAINCVETAKDTRSTHEWLFSDLTPDDWRYYAGHYRGEDFRCLKFYSVGVGSDPRVGHPPEHVRREMAYLAENIEAALTALDAAYSGLEDPESQKAKLRNTVTFACYAFVEFLTIHPYANGNGHSGRYLLTAILKRYGYSLRRFPIDPRPESPYLEGIKMHRDGEPKLLEAFILSCIEK